MEYRVETSSLPPSPELLVGRRWAPCCRL